MVRTIITRAITRIHHVHNRGVAHESRWRWIPARPPRMGTDDSERMDETSRRSNAGLPRPLALLVVASLLLLFSLAAWRLRAVSKPAPGAGDALEYLSRPAADRCGRRRGQVEVLGVPVSFVEVGHVGHYATHAPVVLLHGARFNAKTWEELGTLEALSGPACRRRVIAVDLPGGDNEAFLTREASLATPTGDFLTNVTVALLGFEGAVRPVVVAPSMSGRYALPVLAWKPNAMRGFVAVAPVGFNDVPAWRLGAAADVPTLIIYGETDEEIGEPGARVLRKVPGSVIHVVQHAGHAVYMDNPLEFHRTVVRHLQRIDRGPLR